MKLTGAQILVESLQREGVTTIFGYPGGVILSILGYLYDSSVKFILTRHEQAAAHAADGFSRATGRVGVCLTTAGPGATNIVTGLATAYKDSIPVVAITGQVKTSRIGKDSFQEIDIISLTEGITKAHFFVDKVREIPTVIKEAFFIAAHKRPGPVIISIPTNVLGAKTHFFPEAHKKIPHHLFSLTRYNLRSKIRKAVQMIAQSKKPVICVGGGVINAEASTLLYRVIEKIKIPVTTTLLGIGGFPSNHQLFLGMSGMYGTATANYALMEADLIVTLGARLNDRTTGAPSPFAEKAKLIRVDIDTDNAFHHTSTDLFVNCDIKEFLSEISVLVEAPCIGPWKDRILQWQKEYPLRYKDDGKLKAQYIMEEVCNLTKANAIICTDVGQNQIWAAHFYTYTKPRTFVSSGGLGTAGFGLPASIGVQLGIPEKVVVVVTGDGGIQMNIQELATIAANNLPIKIVLLNNGYLGLTRQFQQLMFKKKYAFTKLKNNPDFVSLARSYGIEGIKVNLKEEVGPALKKAFSIPKPILIDFLIDETENVFPQVPEGMAINEVIWEMD